MSPELSYIDTCCLMMFVNKTDRLRNELGIGQKSADKCVKRGVGNFCVPMPAFGEAICKIHDKAKDRTADVMNEMIHLMDTGFITVRYLNNPSDVYGLAKTLSKDVDDKRDAISPMDALIVAAAAVEQDCRVFYTADVKLQTEFAVSDAVSEWREHHDFDPMVIKPIDVVLN